MNTFGKNIRISLFGESHGPSIGITIDGLPHNFKIDFNKVNFDLKRRLGNEQISTTRREPDNIKIISGYLDDHTTGAPLTIIIDNQDFDNKPYEKGVIRPSHSDLPLYYKTNGSNDFYGGGHSSGRITAPLVVLGSICQQILEQSKIHIVSRILSIKNIEDTKLTDKQINWDHLKKLTMNDFPTIDIHARQLMIKAITKAIKLGDSLGGKVETFIFGMPIGIGEPFFNSIESTISHLMFSIPGVKAIEFGDGFKMCEQYGSEIVDQLEFSNNTIKYLSNHQGGINGGLSNGNYINFTIGLRAPSSFSTPLSSINLETKENIKISTLGRHDPTIVHRALPVIEGLTAFAILDLLLEHK